MRRSKLSEEEWGEVMRQYAKGVRLKELAQKYRMSKPAISQYAARHNVARGVRPPPLPMSKPRREEPTPQEPDPFVAAYDIIQLHIRGNSRTQIAAKLRVPYRRVDEVIAAYPTENGSHE